MATRIGVLERGRLVQLGTPREIYADPVNAYVATRLGSPSINLVPRSLFPGVAAPAATVTIGVRTEHVDIQRDESGPGRVQRVEHLGDQNHLHVSLADADVIVLTNPDDGLRAGERVTLTLTAPLFFGADGARLRH